MRWNARKKSTEGADGIMQYRKDKKGNDLSILGYGCMRFTKKGRSIDLDKAEKEIMTAIQGGVNYFDTAYIYPGSEAALGQILFRNGCRERVKIATKLPHYLVKSREGADKLFAEQLKRFKNGPCGILPDAYADRHRNLEQVMLPRHHRMDQ